MHSDASQTRYNRSHGLLLAEVLSFIPSGKLAFGMDEILSAMQQMQQNAT